MVFCLFCVTASKLSTLQNYKHSPTKRANNSIRTLQFLIQVAKRHWKSHSRSQLLTSSVKDWTLMSISACRCSSCCSRSITRKIRTALALGIAYNHLTLNCSSLAGQLRRHRAGGPPARLPACLPAPPGRSHITIKFISRSLHFPSEFGN